MNAQRSLNAERSEKHITRKKFVSLYILRVNDALLGTKHAETADPPSWAKTALFRNYDERQRYTISPLSLN